MTEVSGGKASFLYSRWAHGDQLVATHASFAYAQRANPGAGRVRNRNGTLWAGLGGSLSLGSPRIA